MAEKVVVVCDVYGSVPAETVVIRANAHNRQKDLCAKHLRELLSGSRTPKRGRRPGSTSTKPAARASATTAKRTARKSSRKSASRRRTTRARRKASSSA